MESTFVSGSVRYGNGQLPDLCFHARGNATVGNRTIDYKCTILGTHIMVEYPEAFSAQPPPAQDIIRFTQQLVESIVLSEVAVGGVGLLPTVEWCRLSTRERVRARVDRAPASEDLRPDQKQLYNLIGSDARLRSALRDFNQGLLDREESPLFFYRAVETLAKVISNRDDLGESGWNAFHSKLGTQFSDMQLLHGLNRDHRHGTHRDFSDDEHSTILAIARRFVSESLKFLLGLGTSPNSAPTAPA